MSISDVLFHALCSKHSIWIFQESTKCFEKVTCVTIADKTRVERYRDSHNGVDRSVRSKHLAATSDSHDSRL